MQTCKGYCDFLTKELINIRGGFWDKENASRCTICQIRFFTPEKKCPCCKTLLRKNPHDKKSKDRLRDVQ